MANQGKRAWKLQENVAHGSQVTCLALGPSSGRVMVTGGEDRKVNMWAIGKPNVIMSLSGHTTPIESVYFNNSEELVLAGSQSGTLKIWDLEAAKIVRTLTGHKSGIRCVDFHPYGEFVASGSSDTNLKLWDVRRKGCIFTYKGHTNTVNHLRFSPDGRWIISAGEDGVAKLWDLTAGKILNDFNKHTASVNRIEFHPKEFLLATCSSDRTVKFWDLETFDMVSSTEAEQSAIRTISFHPEGHCLFSGSQDSLRVYGWEPMVCYESYSLSWGKVSDLSFSTNQLIGASFAQTNVSVWVIDLAHLDGVMAKHEEELQLLSKQVVKTEIKGVASDTVSQQNLPRKHSPQRKSFNTRPRTTSTKPRVAMKEEDQAADVGGQNVEPQKYDTIFKPSSALNRSPVSERRKPEPFKAPIEQAKERDAGVADVKKASAISGTAVELCQPIKTEEKTDAEPKLTHVGPHIASKIQSQCAVEEPVQDVAISQMCPDGSNVRETPSNGKERKGEKIANPVNIPGPQPSEKALNVPPEVVCGIAMSDFLPVVKDIAENQSKTIIPKLEDDAALTALRKSHESICTIMNTRLKNLSVVGQMWTDGEIKTAVQTATSMPDQAILVDLLNVLILKQTLWNLDICVVVLPQLKVMLSSKYESYLETGCSVLRLILKSFAPVIKSNMAAPPVAVGCDIVREERYQKCKRCHSYLLDIKSHANKLAQVPGKHGALNRQIALALSVID